MRPCFPPTSPYATPVPTTEVATTPVAYQVSAAKPACFLNQFSVEGIFGAFCNRNHFHEFRDFGSFPNISHFGNLSDLGNPLF
jgi:hypothetical protein